MMTGSQAAAAAPQSNWFAVVTSPRHEKSVMTHLENADIHAFLPTCSSERVWRNRTRQVITLPLFPTYLFVRMQPRERGRVLGAPGVRQIVGTCRGPLPVDDAEIDALRRTLENAHVEPYPGPLAIGQRVQVIEGAMRGVQGILLRRKNTLRLIISVQLINQHASIEVDASIIEPLDPLEPLKPVEPLEDAISARAISA
jgi:transcription antitermination factor NusG